MEADFSPTIVDEKSASKIQGTLEKENTFSEINFRANKNKKPKRRKSRANKIRKIFLSMCLPLKIYFTSKQKIILSGSSPLR